MTRFLSPMPSPRSAPVGVLQTWFAWIMVRSLRTPSLTLFSGSLVFEYLRVRFVIPQSQGGAERFNRTLLGLIRKVCDESGADWKDDLDVLVHLYRTRPHNTTGIPPMQAMVGWMPRQFLVEDVRDACALSEYVSLLNERSARIRDVIEEELSTRDFLDTAAPCPYLPGHNVMLLHSDRRQKRSSPFEKGWVVSKIISPSTVVIRSAVSPNREKVVNVALLNTTQAMTEMRRHLQKTKEQFTPAGTVGLDLVPAVTSTLPAHAYNLRRRSAIQQPVPFCEDFLTRLIFINIIWSLCSDCLFVTTGDGVK